MEDVPLLFTFEKNQLLARLIFVSHDASIFSDYIRHLT